MSALNFIDRAEMSSVRKTADGYLVADVLCSRAGIQEYAGSELGRPDLAIVRVYRPESEVFAADSMATYAYRPITDGHPPEPVSAKTWKALSKGSIGSEVVRDGEAIRVPMMLMDAVSIADYEAGGARELSMGYAAEIVFGDGVTPRGEPFDATMSKIRTNHMARVPAGRAGPQFRIGDWRAPGLDVPTLPPNGGHTMADAMRKVIVDGLTIDTTEQGAQALEKLTKQLGDSDTAKAKLIADHAAALALKDADLAKKDAEIDSLKAKQLSDAQIDARVQSRADLIATAKSIADADYTGKSEADIRKAVVLAKFGDAMKDKPEAYIAARFDILADEAKADPVRKALLDNKQTPNADDPAAARAKMLADMQSAHLPAKH